MRNDFSRTAEAMAMARALEQFQPTARRIIADPYAAQFLQNARYRWLLGAAWRARAVLKFLNWWAPGGQEYICIRPRLVDELVAAQVAQGVRQIVMLGAGFDTLAWRLQDVLPAAAIVFEIDHPATQAVKRQVSQTHSAPPNVRFVPVDFEQDEFGAKLCAAGFVPAQRSVFVWVGVSYYLTANAVTQTFARLAELAPAGSLLIWDYLLADVIAGTSNNRDALSKARRAAQLGEPWLFGLEPNAVGDYLAHFGFTLQHDYDPAELRARYAPERPLPMNYIRIVTCERAA